MFCVILTIFNPLLTIFAFLSKFLGFNGLFYFGIADLFWIIILTLFGLYSGIMLWAVKPGAVRKARAYLITTGAYAVYLAVYNFYILKPSNPSASQIGTTAGAFIRILVLVAVGMSYLRHSKRVKATYGELLSDES